MPIRITCPSCSATLSVKDEFAGRSVKCPKCGGVIPASQPAPPPAPEPPAASSPAPEPEKLPLDEPERPAKGGSKITGKPVGKSRDDDDDDDDRPRRKRRDEEDDRDRDEDRPRSRKKRDDDDRDRDRDDERSDRPAKRRRRDEDDDDDRPTRGKKASGGSNTPVILAVVGFFMLTCCGGVGYGVYWTYNKAKETVEKVKEELETKNVTVNKTNYMVQLEVGSTTRKQTESLFGKGRSPTADDLSKVFGNDKASINTWQGAASKTRAVIWQNGEDYILAMFHPDGGPDARTQMKHWKPKSGPAVSEGTADDAAFARQHPVKKDGTQPPGKAITPGTKVQAEDLAREFKADPRAAADKYVGKTFSVNGKLTDLEIVGGDMGLILEGADGMRVSCAQKKHQAALSFAFARGQRLVIEGRCVGATPGSVSLNDCSITSSEKDPAEQVGAAALVAAYRTDTSGDATFKGKQVRVTNAVIEKLMPDGTIIAAPSGGKKGTGKKIRVECIPNYRDIALTPLLRVGGSVTIRGLCEGATADEIVITGAWCLH